MHLAEKPVQVIDWFFSVLLIFFWIHIRHILPLLGENFDFPGWFHCFFREFERKTHTTVGNTGRSKKGAKLCSLEGTTKVLLRTHTHSHCKPVKQCMNTYYYLLLLSPFEFGMQFGIKESSLSIHNEATPRTAREPYPSKPPFLLLFRFMLQTITNWSVRFLQVSPVRIT